MISQKLEELCNLPTDHIEQLLLMLEEDKSFRDLYSNNMRDECRLVSRHPIHHNMLGYMSYAPLMQVDEAATVLSNAIDKLRKKEGDAMTFILEKLSTKGFLEVVEYMSIYNTKNSQAIAEILAADNKIDLDSLFTGRPALEIVVYDTEKLSWVKNRYEVFLRDKQGEEYLLRFPTNADDTIIYLWFLLYPSEGFVLNRINRNYNNLHLLMSSCFSYKKFTLPKDEMDKFRNYKTRINKAVREAVNSLDKPDWYQIGNEDNRYYLPLAEEQIHLPKSLIDFRKRISLVK